MKLSPNHHRMFELIDETFATRTDPGQLQVTKEDQAKLLAIHPSTMLEKADENGPLIWVLLVPTTREIMQQFLSGAISERQILKKTQPGQSYDCIYLCSVTTLPEARGKGDTRKLVLAGIAEIRQQHAIRFLFVWPFTTAGEQLADALARETGLDLLRKI